MRLFTLARVMIRPMTGRTLTRQRLRFAAALAATLVAGAAFGSPGQAQVGQESTTVQIAPAAAAGGPQAGPAEQASFAEAFAEFRAPTAPAPTDPAAASTLATTLGTGSASYYADRFHGRRTASGEVYDNTALTAAHRTLPFGTRVRVTNPATGASVVVRINDRGPFTPGRTIDVSRAAAEQLGLIRAGHAPVALDLIEG